ncbi:MAG: hypothetical protein WCL06_13475, partial [Bacteroidota bacterium]
FRTRASEEFKWMRIIMIAALLITWFSFLFSVKAPSSHTFLILFPLAMIWSYYSWQNLFLKKWFRILMVVMLFSVFITDATLARYNYYKVSVYRNRELILQTIQHRDYKMMGPRRSFDRNE